MMAKTMGSEFAPGDQVRSSRFGAGKVVMDNGPSVIVRFEHSLEECEKQTLESVTSLVQALEKGEWHTPAELLTHVQAEAIQSVNDVWGVFSRSRIELLPHQLWVCRRVLETWPARWLVADDVGLGKTIEAGLILWPLLARGTVKRLLVICPASLVEQWQQRLRTMFDIRLTQYTVEADTPQADFWNTHNQIVASLQTLRLDRQDRHRRLMESEPWDLLIVDEAHHLNADEQSGPTLGYKFIHQFVDNNRVNSIVFFTGTPHRGKNFGFISLLHLLRSDLFNPEEALLKQLPNLRQVMIRNNKQNVTDLKGRRLFEATQVSEEVYSFSTAEAHFYETLTEFIATGKAYASSLGATEGKAVILVLIAMQKLASSSVAAIRRAFKRRLARIQEIRRELDLAKRQYSKSVADLAGTYEGLDPVTDSDKVSELEEQIAELTASLVLMEDEEPRLKHLIVLADQITRETKLERILEILDERLAGESVLFFTEYKATQSLLMSALIAKFGPESVTFINGDERAEEVVDSQGRSTTVLENRAIAAERFNSAKVRFLVSTEAAGEGIDLQESCHHLMHVDLPWNPMRLHQRVGRLNRYGQTKRVQVVTIRNPATVESLIWDKLYSKMKHIMMAFGQVMDEPEDLMQLVLGMTAPSLFNDLFSEASEVPAERLASWFDEKTAKFGGQDVVNTVKSLVGHCASFDFQQMSDQLPRVDLPALKPFFVAMLKLNRRLVRENEEGIGFKTPDVWLQATGIYSNYENMIFDRSRRSSDALKRVLGVGHKLFDHAMSQAKSSSTCLAVLPDQHLKHPLIIFSIFDRVTGTGLPVRRILAATEIDINHPDRKVVLRDWEVLERLNSFSEEVTRSRTYHVPNRPEAIQTAMNVSRALLEQNLVTLDLPFKLPSIEELAILWPGHPDPQPRDELDAGSSETLE